MEEINNINNETSSDNTFKNTEVLPVSISLTDALSGIFYEPSEIFEAVKKSAKKNYWLIPLIILVIISIISTFLVMNDEELVSEIKSKQSAAMKEQFDKAVKEGKMTQEQADQQIEQSEKMFGGSMLLIFGLFGSVFGIIFIFFLKALIYWGGLKIFKGNAGFTDILNVLGLSSIITSIQMVIGTALAIFTGKILINIGPVLFINEEITSKNLFNFLANFDLLHIWYLIIVGIGLAKISNLKTSISISFVFALWFIWVLLVSFGPFGMFMGR